MLFFVLGSPTFEGPTLLPSRQVSSMRSSQSQFNRRPSCLGLPQRARPRPATLPLPPTSRESWAGWVRRGASTPCCVDRGRPACPARHSTSLVLSDMPRIPFPPFVAPVYLFLATAASLPPRLLFLKKSTCLGSHLGAERQEPWTVQINPHLHRGIRSLTQGCEKALHFCLVLGFEDSATW